MEAYAIGTRVELAVAHGRKHGAGTVVTDIQPARGTVIVKWDIDGCQSRERTFSLINAHSSQGVGPWHGK